jgi:hypothetical protein
MYTSNTIKAIPLTVFVRKGVFDLRQCKTAKMIAAIGKSNTAKPHQTLFLKAMTISQMKDSNATKPRIATIINPKVSILYNPVVVVSGQPTVPDGIDYKQIPCLVRENK